MLGNWHIPEVSVFSNSSIPALDKFRENYNSGFEYKSLGLLSSDDKAYYLVDWKTTDYYLTKPNVYIIPRVDNLVLNLIVAPYVLATPVPPISPTPTLTTTVTITPTP